VRAPRSTVSTVTIAPGVRLFVDIEGPGLVPDGPRLREKPTLILLHGGPGYDHSGFKPLFSRLADVAQQRGEARQDDADQHPDSHRAGEREERGVGQCGPHRAGRRGDEFELMRREPAGLGDRARPLPRAEDAHDVARRGRERLRDRCRERAALPHAAAHLLDRGHRPTSGCDRRERAEHAVERQARLEQRRQHAQADGELEIVRPSTCVMGIRLDAERRRQEAAARELVTRRFVARRPQLSQRDGTRGIQRTEAVALSAYRALSPRRHAGPPRSW